MSHIGLFHGTPTRGSGRTGCLRGFSLSVLFLFFGVCSATVADFRAATATAARDLENTFAALRTAVVGMSKTVSKAEESMRKGLLHPASGGLNALTLVTDAPYAGCGPYAIDTRPDRMSEAVVYNGGFFIAPDAELLAWAAPSGNCICNSSAALWNMRLAAAGVSQSAPCPRVCQIDRLLDYTAILDDTIPSFAASLGIDFVTFWYFIANSVQGRGWVPPFFSLAPFNQTYMDVLQCKDNPTDYLTHLSTEFAWSDPYFDPVYKVPMITVAASSFSTTNERLGTMCADFTLESTEKLCEKAAASIGNALVVLASKKGSLLSRTRRTSEVLFGNVSHSTTDLNKTFPDLYRIATMATTAGIVVEFDFRETRYVAVARAFDIIDLVFISIAAKSDVTNDATRLIVGLSVGITLPIVFVLVAVVFGQSYYSWKLKSRVSALEKELVSVKASDLLGTPAEDAIKSLVEIKDRYKMKKEDKGKLSSIISLIACNRLYKADYMTKRHHGILDKEVDRFLVDTVVVVETEEKQNGTPTETPRAKATQASMKLIAIRTVESMNGFGRWDFDVLTLPADSPAGPLEMVGWAALESGNLIDFFNIDRTKLGLFLKELERGYFVDNPYHNNSHAADVTQAAFCMVTAAPGMPFSQLEQLATYFATLAHDLRHPGVNNNFLIATKDTLALRYNGISVLESMHASEAIQLLLTPALNFLSNLPTEAFNEFYATVVQLILATDMSRHIEITSQFAALINSNELNMSTKSHRLLALKMIIKFADISNPSRSWSACEAWATRVMTEFFRQGEQEKRLAIPVSPFMDKETADIPKCQGAFSEFVVMPCASLIIKFIPSLESTLIGNIRANVQHWKTVVKPPGGPSSPSTSQL